MPEKIREFRVSNDAFDDPAELQRRLADEGYLFFRRLQDPDKMRELRRVMMTKIQEVGWLLPDTRPLRRYRRHNQTVHRRRSRIR